MNPLPRAVQIDAEFVVEPATARFDVERSDGGNKFLCLDCLNATARTGGLSESEIWCNEPDFSPMGHANPVPFVVTRCTRYRSRSAWNLRVPPAAMEAQAYYIVVGRDSGKLTLVPPGEFKRRRSSGEEQ